MKHLYLVRHAKSSWKDATLADRDRPLNKRGKRDAPRMGEFIKGLIPQPEILISSPAKRAFKTAKIIAKSIEYPIEQIQKRAHLYDFSLSVAELLMSTAHVDDSIKTIMLFGHNHTFTDVANKLGKTYFDNVPTCGLVLFRFHVESWKDLSIVNSEYRLHMFPKMLQVDEL